MPNAGHSQTNSSGPAGGSGHVHQRETNECGPPVSPPCSRYRLEATGPGGRVFPALDADMSLTPAGQHSTRLSLAGAYRPPLAALGAGLDRAVVHEVADATVRSLLARVADVLTRPPEPPGAVQRTGITRAAARRAAPECLNPAALRTADQAGGDRARRS
jgi:hypothetical protein